MSGPRITPNSLEIMNKPSSTKEEFSTDIVEKSPIETDDEKDTPTLNDFCTSIPKRNEP